MRPAAPIYARRHAFIGVMVAAVVLAQTLGLVHRVLAGHGMPTTVTAAAAAATATCDPWTMLFKAAFAGHHDDRDCRVFDQSAASDLATGTWNGADTPTATLEVVAWRPVWHVAAPASAFRARGPPSAA